MKQLFISAVAALMMMSCGQTKQETVTEELKEPFDPRDTSTTILCDSITEKVTNEKGDTIYKRSFVCDSHYVSSNSEAAKEYERKYEAYLKAKEAYEKAKEAK